MFNILNIEKDHVIILENNIKKNLYFFKIEPIYILSLDRKDMESTIEKYKEFLKSIDLEFSIYIENLKINISDYYFNIDISDNPFILDYKRQLENNIKDNNIYVSHYYILIKLNDTNIFKVLEKFKILESIGNQVRMLNNKNEIDQFIYNSLNKVDSYD